jgi:hypothetical protein
MIIFVNYFLIIEIKFLVFIIFLILAKIFLLLDLQKKVNSILFFFHENN